MDTSKSKRLAWILGTVLATAWVSPAAMAQADKSRAAASSSTFKHWQVRTTANGFFLSGDSNALDLDVEDTTDFALDLTYFITPNIAVQLLATYVNVQIESGGDNIGAVDLLPPILTAQYHFTNIHHFEPYIGAGINYNHFGNESGVVRDLGASVEDTIGFVGEIGTDFNLSAITPGMYGNFNVKYLTFDADIEAGGNDIDELEVDAVIVGAGVGFRF